MTLYTIIPGAQLTGLQRRTVVEQFEAEPSSEYIAARAFYFSTDGRYLGVYRDL